MKKRLPTTPTLQAGFLLRCYGKGEQITRAMGQIVGNLRAAIFTTADREGREFPQLLRFAEYSDIPFGFVITSAARDLLVHGYGKSRFLAPKPALVMTNS